MSSMLLMIYSMGVGLFFGIGFWIAHRFIKELLP